MNCELDVSVCNASEDGSKKCLNGGRCIEGIGATFSCECLDGTGKNLFLVEYPYMRYFTWLISGWTGARCEENVDECLDSPCENGGMCMDIPGDFICSCPFGNDLSLREIQGDPSAW